ncbi:transcriptional regulator [Clostridium zeae]|uniref:Transcriptional regulator n=1 Tax=Clostridium zeae TaxID=2759022 RepID=A0ABQ1E626_9CLOT|nr:YafY family protein [Clostridium zeae]GFZ30211.1 transcriptional regulator [Clostridium zeae]
MKLERVVSIIMLLLVRKRVSALELSNMFEVSLRTIYRDIETIGYSGIPIVSTPGPNGGFGILESYKIEKGLFTTEDIIALLTALGAFQSVLESKDILNTIAKIKGMVPEESINDMELKAKQITIDNTPWIGAKTLKIDMDKMKGAINDRHLLEISYSNQKGKASKRTVEPYRLVFKDSSWYLVGYCTLKREFRVFKLSRISYLKIKEDTFVPRNFEISSLKLTGNVEKKTIKMLIDLSAKEWLIENFEVQKIESDGNGKLIAEIFFVEDDFGYSQLFRLGKYGECLEPENVRLEMKNRLNSLLSIYE